MPHTYNLPWEQISEKIKRKHLAEDEKRDLKFDILRIAPNTEIERHKHLDIEWVYVLEGEFHDEFGTYPEGYFKFNPKNSIHSSASNEEGCTLLLCWTGKLQLIEEKKEMENSNKLNQL